MSEYERDDLRREDEETGIVLKIIADTDAESPVEADIEADQVVFAVYHRNRLNPSDKKLPTAEDAKAFAAENAGDDKEWAVFDLFAYEHGNIMFKAGASNPFGCDFDSGQIGIIALKRAEFSGDLLEIANSICDGYSDWANGEVYGYVIEGVGDDNDSCWGFVGDPEDDGAFSEGYPIWEQAVADRKEEMAKVAMHEADEAARLERIEASRKVRLDEVLNAARVFAEPNDTPAAQRLKEALEAYEGAA